MGTTRLGVWAGLFDIRRNQGRRNRQWDAGGRPSPRRNLRRRRRHGQPYIFDCGPGFWRNSQANTPAYGGKIAALEPKNLTRLFLTHLHFDHTEGLSEFMLAPWTYYRDGPPQVYGPPGTEDVVHHLTEAYTKDIDLQMFGLEQPMPPATL